MRPGEVAATSLGRLERIQAVCDRFESDWRAGGRPRLEDRLVGVAGPERAALVRELLAVELHWRRRAGERPGAEDYLARFPGDIDAVRAALGAPPAGGGSGRGAPSSRDAARDLLFGLLALQNDFIGRDDLLAAFAAWVADKARPLAQLLVDRGALDDVRRALLEALVAEHLKRHGGDPAASLAAVSSLGPLRDDLQRIDDPNLRASLAATASRSARSGDDAGATATNAPSSRRAGARFRILRFHREGGLGRVYLARDEELGREVALKEIRPDKLAEADHRGRFVLEAEINGGLEHPGIVPVYSLGTYDDGRPFYAMRFVEGDSLKEAIEAYHKANPQPDPGTVEFRKLLGRFVDVCEAIAFAHSKGVLHRDLKPHNVMLGRYGETLLIDWGLAKATGRREPVGLAAGREATLVPPSGSGHAPTVGVLGSPPYMSPEQAAGAAEALGPATDVYGLGAILFALLTGEPPVDGKTTEEVLDRARRGAIRPLRSLNPNVPHALEAICLKAMAPKPGDRYTTAQALADDVEFWLADEPVSAWEESAWLRLCRWLRRHRTLVAAGAAATLAGLAGLVVVLTIQAEDNRRLRIANQLARSRADLALEAIDVLQTGKYEGENVFHNPMYRKQNYDSGTAQQAGRVEDLKRYFLQKLHGLLVDDREPDADGLAGRARTYFILGSLASQMELTGEALDEFGRSRDILQSLVRTHPSNADYRRALAETHRKTAQALTMQSPAAARDSFEEALKILETLVKESPQVPEYRSGLAGVADELADQIQRDNVGTPPRVPASGAA
jgi:eukaryotic-like serine/threonine-protein kinase